MHIYAGTIRQIRSQLVDELISNSYGSLISNRAAVTIASWYQGSATGGQYFAQLASTGEVDHIDLLEAILAERPSADTKTNMALDMLMLWACWKALMSVGE